MLTRACYSDTKLGVLKDETKGTYWIYHNGSKYLGTKQDGGVWLCNYTFRFDAGEEFELVSV